jgi:hypothetical protein
MTTCQMCLEEINETQLLVDHDRTFHKECWNVFVEWFDIAEPVV